MHSWIPYLQDEQLWLWSLSPQVKHHKGEPDKRGYLLQWCLTNSSLPGNDNYLWNHSNFQISIFIRNILTLTELFKTQFNFPAWPRSSQWKLGCSMGYDEDDWSATIWFPQKDSRWLHLLASQFVLILMVSWNCVTTAIYKHRGGSLITK